MKYALIAAAFLLVAHSALAEDKQPPAIDPATCRQLAEYVPPAQGGADYKAGKDVQGNPVAPADISRSAVKVPRVIRFGIDVDVAQYAGIPVPAGQNLTNIGTIELDTKTGDMDFNGQPVEGDALARLRYLCRTAPADKATEQEPKEILHTPDNILQTPPNILHTPDNILNSQAPAADGDKHNQ